MEPLEAETRERLINPELRKVGWNLDDLNQVVKEFSIPFKEHHPDKFTHPFDLISEPDEPYTSSYYALLGKDRKPLAVVEAKKFSAEARLGEEQVKQYAQCIAEAYQSELPFVFYTNGTDIYFWNLGEYPPYKVYVFPTEMIWNVWLLSGPIKWYRRMC